MTTTQTHPYWSYGLAVARPVIDALAEGRRQVALTLAVQWDDTDEGLIERAVKFEAYLKGEAPVTAVEVSEYEDLVNRSNRLMRLEAAEVDNWEGYPE